MHSLGCISYNISFTQNVFTKCYIFCFNKKVQNKVAKDNTFSPLFLFSEHLVEYCNFHIQGEENYC